MPELQLKFSTAAQLEGARQVEKSLEQQIGKAKALGKEYGALEAQLKALKPAIAAASKEFNAADDAGGKAGGSTKGLVWQLKALKSEAGGIPLLGAAIQAIRHPITAVGLAVGGVVVGLKSWLEHMKKIAELGRELDDAFASAAEKAKSPKVMAIEWNAAMTKMREGIEEAAQKGLESLGSLDKKLQEIEKRMGRVKSLSEKGLEADVKQIDADVASGKITKEEGARRKAAAQASHRARVDWTRVQGAGEKERAVDVEIATLEARRGAIEGEIGVTGESVQEAQQLARQMGISREAAEARLAATREGLGIKTPADLRKLRKRVAAGRKARGQPLPVGGESAEGAAVWAARREKVLREDEEKLRQVEAAEAAAATARVNEAEAAAQLKEREAALGKLGEAAKQAGGDYTKAQVRRREMESERREESDFLRQEREAEARGSAADIQKADAEAAKEEERRRKQRQDKAKKAVESGKPWTLDELGDAIDGAASEVSDTIDGLGNKVVEVLNSQRDQIAALTKTLDTFV